MAPLIAKLVVRRLERRGGGELPAVHVRQVETTWILSGAGLALVVHAILALT